MLTVEWPTGTFGRLPLLSPTPVTITLCQRVNDKLTCQSLTTRHVDQSLPEQEGHSLYGTYENRQHGEVELGETSPTKDARAPGSSDFPGIRGLAKKSLSPQ